MPRAINLSGPEPSPKPKRKLKTKRTMVKRSPIAVTTMMGMLKKWELPAMDQAEPKSLGQVTSQLTGFWDDGVMPSTITSGSTVVLGTATCEFVDGEMVINIKKNEPVK